MLKRHLLMKQTVDDYSYSIQQLADRAQKMLAEEHPDGYFGLIACQKTCNIYILYI